MPVLRRCLKLESEVLCEGDALADAAHDSRSPRPALSGKERWSIAAVASTRPHRVPGRMQPKAPPGGGDRARPWRPVALAHQNAPAPGPSFRRIELTRPPERCGGYAVRPARSGR